MALSCIICEIKRDIGQKSWFFIPPLHSTPQLGGSPSEYCHPVWCGKTRMVGLPDGRKNFEDMYNRLDSIPACDRRTDRRTDRHTDILRRHSPRCAYASRSKNEPRFIDRRTSYKTHCEPTSLITCHEVWRHLPRHSHRRQRFVVTRVTVLQHRVRRQWKPVCYCR